MFERFTPQARRVLVLAQEEARQLDSAAIGTGHLLLGLTVEEEGIAARALGALGITADAVREQLRAAPGQSSNPGQAPRPFTPHSKKVLELALREALQLKERSIGTEHLLLGLVREGEDTGAQILTALGADVARVRELVLEGMAGRTARAEMKWSEALRALPSEISRFRRPLSAEPAPLPIRSADPPDCPRCGATLAEHAKHRLLDIPAAKQGEPSQAFVVVYCDGCGQSLAFRPIP